MGRETHTPALHHGRSTRSGSVRVLGLLAVSAAFCMVAACGATDPPAAGGIPGEPNAVVTRVIDGDTIAVRTGGVEEHVRLIGIDTPESVKRGTEVECFGKEASAHTAELLPEGTPVVLERDVEVRDRYDRLLAYVYRASDGLFVNRALVADGFAQPATYPPNVAHTDTFVAAGRVSRASGKGLWGTCGGDDLYG